MKKKFLWLLVSRLVISRVAGGKATFFRENWYRKAQVSPFTPPDWVFGVAWPLNYATSAWAAAIFASRTAGAERDRGITLWFLQAVSTSIWPRIFGDLKRPDWALKSLILAWCLAIGTSKKFGTTSPAGFWMVPLCLWLTLAIELNAEFVVRNPSRLKRPNAEPQRLTAGRE
jgi:translocator protein